jgi:hypothetical protein
VGGADEVDGAADLAFGFVDGEMEVVVLGREKV